MLFEDLKECAFPNKTAPGDTIGGWVAVDVERCMKGWVGMERKGTRVGLRYNCTVTYVIYVYRCAYIS